MISISTAPIKELSFSHSNNLEFLDLKDWKNESAPGMQKSLPTWSNFLSSLARYLEIKANCHPWNLQSSYPRLNVRPTKRVLHIFSVSPPLAGIPLINSRISFRKPQFKSNCRLARCVFRLIAGLDFDAGSDKSSEYHHIFAIHGPRTVST